MCLRAASRSQFPHSLRWMECFRPSSDIFLDDLKRKIHEQAANPQHSSRSPDLESILNSIADVNVSTHLPQDFSRTIDNLSRHFASYLGPDPILPQVPVVGTLASAEFKDLLMLNLDSKLVRTFSSFIYLSSFLHTYARNPDSRLPVPTIRIGLIFLLSRLVTWLDSHLKPRQLAKFSVTQLRALFLLLLGISVSTEYSSVRNTITYIESMS